MHRDSELSHSIRIGTTGLAVQVEAPHKRIEVRSGPIHKAEDNSKRERLRRLHWGTDVKYLSVRFDQRLTWKKQIDDMRSCFSAARNTLLPLLGQRSFLHLGSKLLLYKSKLRPLLT